ncbi:hypothetical protein EDD85DRAFT_823591 [Armillaria nabsnona]|nr:hypothetical protein EDD85DRAFT_823591 [Armillaria nabsnona]
MHVEEQTIGVNAEFEGLPMDDFDSGLWEISTLEPDVKDEVKKFSSAFQQTIERYQEVEGEGPWKVPQSIRQSVFEAWSDRRKGRYPISYDLTTGYVHIYGDPSLVHQFMAGRLMVMILSILRRRFVDVMAKYFGDINETVDVFESIISTGASPLHSIIHPGESHHKMMKEPDGSITISPTLHRSTQNTSGSETSSTFASDSTSLPGIIVEVAYRNESWPAVLEEVDVWSRSATKHKADLVVAIAIRPNAHEASDPFAVLVVSRDDGLPIVVPFGSGSPVVLPSTFKHPGPYDVSPFTPDVLPGFPDSHSLSRSEISELSPVLPLGKLFQHLDFERIERAFNINISSDDRSSLIEFAERLDLGPLRFALLSSVYN